MITYVTPNLNLSAQTHQNNVKMSNFNPKAYFSGNRQHLFASCGIDTGGCSYYRMRFVDEAIEQKYPTAISYGSRAFFCDINQPMLKHIESIRFQRPNHPNEFNWYNDVLLPAKKKNPFKLIYDTDDILVLEDIPPYNCYRKCFPKGAEAIPFFMEKSDIVTVSTQKLADYYIQKFNLDPQKFVVCQNYPPRYVFDHYSEPEAIHRFLEIGKRKPRICFSCSPSHFDYNDLNHGDDDFSEIMPWIMENRHRYEFIFHGGLNRTIFEHKDDFKFATYGSFLDYPRARRAINADLYIQPLKKSFFNECKSTIKILESWAEGRPIFVQDIQNYKELAPEICFGSAEQLDTMVSNLFSGTPDQYIRMIRDNYQKMQNYWLEAHVDDWIPVVFRIPQWNSNITI